ncbi:MAG TPA: preprotein translocase subunit SecG [Candidatus Angelobacter sp.]|jgi:preprotein translocase subunit SecG|nr:preprotein translocase subunit SecG [Candidatus Angelobacter sp.]
MLTVFITIIHVIVCAVLIIVVLLQHGKSADIAATFGGAGSQTAFGPRGTATLLSRVTTWCAVIFMLTSISLTIFASRKHANSAMENMQSAPTAPAKNTPAPLPPAKK